MAYIGVDWKNDPDHTSPINAANLEIMDNGIKEAHEGIDEINEEIGDIINQSENFFDGQFVRGEQVATSSGAFVSGDTFMRTGHIPISSGVVNIGIKAKSGMLSYIITHYCFYNSNYQKISSGNGNAIELKTAGDLKYQQLNVPANAVFIAFDTYWMYYPATDKWYVSQVQTPTNYVGNYTEINPEYLQNFLDPEFENDEKAANAKITGDRLASIDEQLLNVTLDNKTQDISELSVTWTSGYMSAGGTVNSSSSYEYSQKISVEPGDIITRNKANYTFRYICAFSGNTAISDKGSSTSITDYVVPDGIDGVVVTISASTDSVGVFKIYSTHEMTTYSDVAIRTIRGGILNRLKADSMTTNDALIMHRNSLLRNKTYIFNAKVTDNSWSFLVAHGPVDDSYDSNVYSYGVKITPTEIIPWGNGNKGSGGVYGTAVPHGLTINNRICVIVKVENDMKYTVTLISESGFVKKTFEEHWIGRKGSIYAIVLSGTIYNCELAFGCSDIEKPIWLFGDSYVNIVENRWPYWLTESGIDNCLINAYPGEATPNAISDLRDLLHFGTPRFIVWCLGMNDHDTATAANANWMNGIGTLLSICSEKRITPILATIPNVANATYNNVKKNEWIESKTYRYIDFNKAIGAANEAGASWPDGWLSDDNVHPTEMGARVLAGQAIADVPEFNQP